MVKLQNRMCTGIFTNITTTISLPHDTYGVRRVFHNPMVQGLFGRWNRAPWPAWSSSRRDQPGLVSVEASLVYCLSWPAWSSACRGQCDLPVVASVV